MEEFCDHSDQEKNDAGSEDIGNDTRLTYYINYCHVTPLSSQLNSINIMYVMSFGHLDPLGSC